MARRIVFSTNTANDQGTVIPNECIDFSRFSNNPVLLKQHNWEGEPIGKCTDWKLENGAWSMVPVFHGITEDARLYKEMYEAGYLNACSIGGEFIAEEDLQGRPKLDENGNKICKSFLLYEISMVTLPSNKEAVAKLATNKNLETPENLTAHIYWTSDKEKALTKLSTKIFNTNTMAETINEVTLTADEERAAKEKALAEKQTALKTKLAAEKENGETLPEVIKKAIKEGFSAVFGTGKKAISLEAPAPKDLPEEKPGTVVADEKQPTPIGLKAKKAEEAKKKLDKAKEELEACHEKMKSCEGEEHEAAAKKAEECMAAVKECEKAYHDAMEDDEDEDGEMKAKHASKKTFAATKPILKSTSEMEAEHIKLMSAPKPKPTVQGFNSNIPEFSKLYSTDKRGKLLLSAEMQQLQNSDRNAGNPQSIENARILLASILKDPKFRALAEGVRFNPNKSSVDVQEEVRKYMRRPGLNAAELMNRLETGNFEVYGRDNRIMRGNEMSRNMMKFTATDTFLASPDLYAIEFLTLAIFQLFPSSSWKKDIPMFGATDAENNTGLVWANITAAPNIYIGSQPSNPANYTYTDAAVSISPVPFFLQPMLWYPYLMHQLRYDQMGTGWAQAFSLWAAEIDDFMIYQLASGLPASAVVKTSGISGYQTSARTTNVGSGPNQYYWNQSYNGTVNNAVLNDIISIEQIYRNQNFNLEEANQKPTLVIDPIANANFGQDPQFQSLLTRWIESKEGNFLDYANTEIAVRSRVAAYNTATNTVVNPYSGSIPSTTVGANLGFIPSQVGMAIAALDVFMLQDPTNYGYKMSADMRIGANWLRNNQYGGALYVPTVVSGGTSNT